jgi:hypothetical protein
MSSTTANRFGVFGIYFFFGGLAFAEKIEQKLGIVHYGFHFFVL